VVVVVVVVVVVFSATRRPPTPEGALMAHEGLSNVEVFERMRRQARAERRCVADVAAETLQRLRPGSRSLSAGRRDQGDDPGLSPSGRSRAALGPPSA
jgi:hypothetical protein